MAPILVTGASGFIGRHLVRALADAGHEVRALVRSDAGARRARGAAEVVRGDVGDPAGLRRAAGGVGLVYHLAGAYRGPAAQLEAVHVAGTANLLAALAPGTRLIHVSSTSVYGWDQRWPADEATPARPVSGYGRAKLAAEGLVRDWAGGEAVVVRPTITYGPGDEKGMLARAVGLMARGVRWFPGNGTNRVHLLHVDDLVDGLLRLGDTGEGTYVLGGPGSGPVGRVFELLAEGAGLPPPSFGLPAAAVRPLAPHAVDVLTRDRAYSWDRAATELGWRPVVALEEGVPATGRWLSQQRSRARGFDWRSYLDDPDEGLGTVYERFALRDVLASAVDRTGATSVLHAPAFGMMGFPGLDAVFCARAGLRVGLLDHDPERLDAVANQWAELGLTPETHLVPGPDPARWPERLPVGYDLVFSFAALWWFDDPWAVVAAQARWAGRGVLCCVPNRNVFLRLRARLWHRDLFRTLNADALDPDRLVEAGLRAGLRPAGTGLFDIPPFPDTSVPLARVLRAVRPSRASAPSADVDGQAWAWSILPFLRGEDPTLEGRVARLAAWERFVPPPLAPGLAHHRWMLFERPPSAAGSAGAAAPGPGALAGSRR